MNVDRMRAIDRWMGIPLTFMLTIWLGIIGLINKKPAGKSQKVLFIELSEMGSIIL